MKTLDKADQERVAELTQRQSITLVGTRAGWIVAGWGVAGYGRGPGYAFEDWMRRKRTGCA